MKEVNVCSNGINGNKNETITFKNPHTSDVTVSQAGTNTWPFSSPSSPLTVTAGGSTDATLIGTAGTYYYNTSGCPDLAMVNPKNVVIS